MMGCYMIIKFNLTPADVLNRFNLIHKQPNFEKAALDSRSLEQVNDSWAGLWRAKSLRWVDFVSGCFDPFYCTLFGHAQNGGFHKIVPEKFVTIRGPKDLLKGREWVNIYNESGKFVDRAFSPEYYTSILQKQAVQVVIRLDTPEYNETAFNEAGIAVADLAFKDSEIPPADVVGKFLAIAEAVPGAIAVHCGDGLWRAGTLIAMYMMKHHAFTAREAVGWLEIVRPGTLTGPQQMFLRDKEGILHRAGVRHRQEVADTRAAANLARNPLSAADRDEPAPSGPAAAAAALRRLIAAAVERVDRQILDVEARIRGMQRLGVIPPVHAALTRTSSDPKAPVIRRCAAEPGVFSASAPNLVTR
jgi:hypothetical protein